MAASTGEDFDPFSQEDIRRLLALEAEETSKKNGWETVSQKDDARVWRKHLPGSPINLVKGDLHFPDVPVDAMLEMLTNVDVRRRYDKLFPVMELLEKHDHYNIIYWQSKMPPGVSDREAVQFVTKRKDEESGAWLIMNKTTEHASKPPTSGLVRIETILSGNILRPDKDNPSSTRMTVLLQNDIKGWIPNAITNTFQARAPSNWRDTLYNFYTKEYAEEYQRKKSAEN